MRLIDFAALAGLLSTLSPCVLPLIPIVLAAATGSAVRLARSFTAIGLFVATVGFTIGLDGDVFRKAGGALLGVLLLLPRLQAGMSVATGPIGNWTEQRFSGARGAGWHGQFGFRLLLGTVWSPCVGPTLGAASVMAAHGENPGQIAITMAAFGIGAAADPHRPAVARGFLPLARPAARLRVRRQTGGRSPSPRHQPSRRERSRQARRDLAGGGIATMAHPVDHELLAQRAVTSVRGPEARLR